MSSFTSGCCHCSVGYCIMRRSSHAACAERYICNCCFSVPVFHFQSKQHHKNMEDAKSVNREIASTLEAVMQSHNQLQELVENLQAELGRRDTEIGHLKNLRWVW